MSPETHITEENGSIRMALLDIVRPYADQIRVTLNQMDGSSFWAWGLWRAPNGTNFVESLPSSEEYMQCAGSAHGLALEVRYLEPDGTARQYTIGKPEGDSRGDPTVKIPFRDGERSVMVYPYEVFSADEAATVFYSYFLTDKVSSPYLLRELDLSWPPKNSTST